MGSYNFVFRNILLPATDIVYNTSILKWYNHLKKMEFSDKEELKKLSNKRFKGIVRFAFNNSPFYHRFYKNHNVSIDEIKTIDDAIKLPIITKEDIKNNYTDFIPISTQKKIRYVMTTTGGTTGEPLSYRLDKEMISSSWGTLFRGWNQGGYQLGDKRLTFAGGSLTDKKRNIFSRFRTKLERNTVFNAVTITEEKLKNIVYTINKKIPSLIRGYPSSISLLAKYIINKNIKINNIKSVFTTAEVLQENQRKTIEKAFQVPVFDSYGVRDGGGSAFECKYHSGMHIDLETGLIFALSENSENVEKEVGALIHTSYTNFAFPFINVRVGDKGMISKEMCKCGRPHKKLIEIYGRETDIITFSNGISLSGPSLTLIMKEFPISQYQIVQTKKDQLRVSILTLKNWKQSDYFNLLNSFRTFCGEGVEVVIDTSGEFVYSERSSKLKFIYSLVDK